MSYSVLLTGAAGYIGSHTALALLNQGYKVICIDNYCNSSPEIYERIYKLAHAQSSVSVDNLVHAKLDIRDEIALSIFLDNYKIDACIHFAALKAVGESTLMPIEYLHNNMGGLLCLLNVLKNKKINKFVFSSSATVYGEPETVPLNEHARLKVVSPYGLTKLMGEQVLAELIKLGEPWRIGILRYFNPVGAHPSGEIGENPHGIPNNLMPYITQTAAGLRKQLTIFGNDYSTADGTGVRDYIHVEDLAQGHIAALKRILEVPSSFTVNLGTGHGTSVKELVETFEKINAVKVPRTFGSRRTGDVAECYADVSLAKEVLNWQSKRTVEDMCRDAWRWQINQNSRS